MAHKLAAIGGDVRLPVGYTFCPTDEIFVAYYLKKKVFSRRKNDIEVVPEFDVFSTDPRILPSGGRVYLGKKFFFFDLKDKVFENIDKREAEFGEWRTEREVKDRYVASKNKLVGKMNRLEFWRRKGENLVKTRWIMHEYRLYLPAKQPDPSQMSSWAGYKIFLKHEDRSKRARTTFDTERFDSDGSGVEEEEEEEEEEGDEEEEEMEKEKKKEEEEEPIEVDLAVESGSNIGPPSPSSGE